MAGVPLSTVEFLLRHNAKIINSNHFMSDYTSCIESSLVEPLYDHVDLEMHNPNGLTAFHLAVRSDHLEALHRLFRRGADVNQRTADLMKSTPLQLAVEFASPQCVELLLQHGADINAQDTVKYTALFRAATCFQYFNYVPDSQASKIALLLEYGADVDDVLLNSWMVETSKKLLKIMIRYVALRDQERAKWRNDSMLPYTDPELYSFYLDCQKETNRMRECIIFRDLSVYQFLKRNPRNLRCYVKNTVFVTRLMDHKLQKGFPNYQEMLMKRYQLVCKQNKLFAEATKSLEIMLGFYYDYNHLVTEKIVACLRTRDMWNLIYATDVVDSR